MRNVRSLPCVRHQGGAVVTAAQIAKLRALHAALPPAPWQVEAGEGGDCTIEQISAVQLVAQLRNLLAEIFDDQTEGVQ